MSRRIKLQTRRAASRSRRRTLEKVLTRQRRPSKPKSEPVSPS